MAGSAKRVWHDAILKKDFLPRTEGRRDAVIRRGEVELEPITLISRAQAWMRVSVAEESFRQD